MFTTKVDQPGTAGETVEAAKRQSRVADAAGGKIAAADPRKAMLGQHLRQTGRAEPDQRGETQGELASLRGEDLHRLTRTSRPSSCCGRSTR
jgi:hypothetical protein